MARRKALRNVSARKTIIARTLCIGTNTFRHCLQTSGSTVKIPRMGRRSKQRVSTSTGRPMVARLRSVVILSAQRVPRGSNGARATSRRIRPSCAAGRGHRSLRCLCHRSRTPPVVHTESALPSTAQKASPTLTYILTAEFRPCAAYLTPSSVLGSMLPLDTAWRTITTSR